MQTNIILYHTLCCLLDLAKECLITYYVIGFQKKSIGLRSVFALLLVPSSLMMAETILPEGFLYILYLPIILIVLQIIIGIWHVKSFLLSIIAYVWICEIDYFSGSLMNMIFGGSNSYLQTKNIGASVFSLIMVFVIASCCNKRDITFYKKNFGHKKSFILIEVGVLFLNIGIMGVFFVAIGNNQTGSFPSILLLAVVILAMLLSVISLIFYCVIMNAKEYKNINAVNEKRLESQKNYYERLREIDKDTRRFRHDIQNHVQVILNLIKEEKHDQARSYIEDVSQHIEDIKPVISSGNGIVDAILNEKMGRCQEKNIVLKVKGIIHAPMLINDYDICTIFANALDNAIDACEKMEMNRWIEVSIGLHQDFLAVLISNSIAKGPVCLKTTKTDRRNHGFGIQNLTECVKRNNGKVRIWTEEDKFVLDIVVSAF